MSGKPPKDWKDPKDLAEIYGRIADLLIEKTAVDPRLKAIWIEGKTTADLRRPYRRLELHFAADEPDFNAVLGDLEAILKTTGDLATPKWSDVPRLAKQLEATINGAPVIAILEKTSLLAKRPREAVVALADKTGHLTHVMDFSRK